MSDDDGRPLEGGDEAALERLWPDPAIRERNLDIVAARARGMSSRTVAKTFSVSVGHIKRLMKQWRDINPSLRHQDANEILDDILMQHMAAIEELALISSSTKMDAVRVGAIKARLDALRTVTEILQATGNLPQDLGTLRLQVDVRQVSARFVAVLDQFDVPDEVVQALLGVLEGETPPAIGVG